MACCRGQTVVLITSGATAEDRDAVAALLGQAGAVVTGDVALTDAVGDPARANQLRELTSQLLPSGAQLPAASDTGSLAGGLLGGVLVTRQAGRRRHRHRPKPSSPGSPPPGSCGPARCRRPPTSSSCSPEAR